jgi:predicted class III extradiol MEMO1 family dioxygenase
MDEKLPDLEKPDSVAASFSAEHTVDLQSIVIDHVAEKRLVRKLDIYIIPIVMLLYLFSFLDR